MLLPFAKISFVIKPFSTNCRDFYNKTEKRASHLHKHQFPNLSPLPSWRHAPVSASRYENDSVLHNYLSRRAPFSFRCHLSCPITANIMTPVQTEDSHLARGTPPIACAHRLTFTETSYLLSHTGKRWAITCSILPFRTLISPAAESQAQKISSVCPSFH